MPRAQTLDDPDRRLRGCLRQCATEYIRWGFKRNHAELRAFRTQGVRVCGEQEKVQRVWCAEGLKVLVKRRTKVASSIWQRKRLKYFIEA